MIICRMNSASPTHPWRRAWIAISTALSIFAFPTTPCLAATDNRYELKYIDGEVIPSSMSKDISSPHEIIELAVNKAEKFKDVVRAAFVSLVCVDGKTVSLAVRRRGKIRVNASKIVKYIISNPLFKSRINYLIDNVYKIPRDELGNMYVAWLQHVVRNSLASISRDVTDPTAMLIEELAYLGYINANPNIQDKCQEIITWMRNSLLEG